MQIYKFITCPIQVNTYLAFDETQKGFIVDPGGYSGALTQTARDHDVSVEYIILTHGHADHIGGVEEFLEEFPRANVIAFEQEREMLENPQINASLDICGRPVTIKADRFVKDHETMAVGNTELTFIHTPGHTKGSCCYYLKEEGVLFSGDTLFCESIGRTDFPGGSFQELKDAVHNKLFTLPDETAVLPGHMGSTTIGHEKGNNPFV